MSLIIKVKFAFLEVKHEIRIIYIHDTIYTYHYIGIVDEIDASII